MKTHTSEPWAIGKDGDIWANNGTHCVHLLPDTLNAEENAARIVACVNACAGIDTERLEAMAKPRKSLDDLLAEWSVDAPGMWQNDDGPADWFAVSNDDGIVAYFGDESAAFRFRLAEINRALNG